MATSTPTTLRDNLEALPPAARQLIEAAPEGGVQLHANAAGMSASVRTPDGRWVRIHSGRAPVVEAERLVESARPAGASATVILVSPGLGYFVDAIARRWPATRFLVIEPFPALARALLERRDWRGLLTNGRLTLLLGPDYKGAADAWRLVDERAAPATAIVEHPVMKREFPADMARACLVADHILRGAQSNADARRRFAGRYLLNTLANLPALVGEGDAASLANLFPGVPAVVVAAGPSLDQNVRHLKAIDDRVLIIAVDTTLRPLRAAGIRPQLVVAVDPSERNAQHLIGVADSAGSWLVSEGSIGAGVFDEFTGRAFGYKVSDHHPWPWLRTLGFERGTLRAWGSVVTTAFDLAWQMGCDPIVFVGTDLSYTGGLHYCRSTIHENAAWESASPESRAEAFAAWMREYGRPTCHELDVHGNTVVSTPDFVQFRNWLVARSEAVRPRRVLNATGAGILHGGRIEQTGLEALALPALAGGSDAIRQEIAAAWRRSAARRDAVVATLEHACDSARRDELPLDSWLAFAGATVPTDDISAGLDAAWHAVERRWQTPVAITQQPQDVFWIDDWSARFVATATGGPAPAVQWQVSHDEGATWSDVAGATDVACEVALTPADIGARYRAIFTNKLGSVASASALVSIAVNGVVADLNGDHQPDILWRNGVTGATVISYLDGVVRVGLGELETVPDLGWTLAGAGDFDGDGRPEILWRHSPQGINLIWHLDGVNRRGATVLDWETDLDWTIAGTGDFNGDGKPDILWRHRVAGHNRVWFMDGVSKTSEAALDSETDVAWTIAAVDDFTGDGQPDILWRNARTGCNRLWRMDGITRLDVIELDAEPDLHWAIVGAGDFNRDGKPDILWRNTADGAIRIWYMDGVTRTGTGTLDTTSELTWLIGAEESARRAAGA